MFGDKYKFFCIIILTFVSTFVFGQKVLHITRDIDLSKVNISADTYSILSFEGGKLINGTLTGNNTVIDAPPYQIFQNVKLKGSWNVATAYFEWFGARGDGKTDDRKSIQNALDSPFRNFLLPTKTYIVSADPTTKVGLTISHPINIVGTAQYDFDGGTMIASVPNAKYNNILVIKSQGVTLQNIIFTGNGSQVQDVIATPDDDEYYTRLTLRKVTARNCNGNAINLRTFGSRFEQVTTGYCEVGFYIHGNETKKESYTSNVLEGCLCFNANTYAYKITYMDYTVMNACAGDRNGFNDKNKNYSGYPYYFFGCNNITMNSCACESSYNTIKLDCCNGFVVNAMYDWSAKNKLQAGYDINKQIMLKNCRNIAFNNCTLGSRVENRSSFFLEKCSQISFANCSPRKNGGSTDKQPLKNTDFKISESSAVTY